MLDHHLMIHLFIISIEIFILEINLYFHLIPHLNIHKADFIILNYSLVFYSYSSFFIIKNLQYIFNYI
jgi:hypothetical protein